jgi:hypothetical protein
MTKNQTAKNSPSDTANQKIHPHEDTIPLGLANMPERDPHEGIGTTTSHRGDEYAKFRKTRFEPLEVQPASQRNAGKTGFQVE